MTKQFDRELHSKFDIPAREVFLNFLRSMITENDDVYGPDLVSKTLDGKVYYYEVEVKNDWIYEFPYKTLHIPYRKAKFLKYNNICFVVLSNDMSYGLLVNPDKLNNIINKDTCYTQDEEYFEIDLNDCTLINLKGDTMGTEKRESIGALWLQKSKDGKSYLSGNIQGQKVVVFKNEHKNEDKHPDYRVYPHVPRQADDNPPF